MICKSFKDKEKMRRAGRSAATVLDHEWASTHLVGEALAFETTAGVNEPARLVPRSVEWLRREDRATADPRR